ncbi:MULTISPECIES: hypothetical protein [Fischerella]|nr:MULTISPECIES: hypothetical protein [Fischerella]
MVVRSRSGSYGASLSIPMLVAACGDRVLCALRLYSIFQLPIAFG